MIDAFVYLIIILLVVGVLVALVIYVADNLLPDPINRIVKIAAIVIACLAVILVLLKMVGFDTGGLDVPKLG
jgi:hypothetical protein